MEIKIRNSKIEDIEIITDFQMDMAFETEDLKLDRDLLRKGVETVLEREEVARYFIADVDSIPAGMLMITYEWSDWRNGWVWWIQSVFVKPGFRSLGIYKKLYEHIKDIVLKSQNIRGIRLYVDKRNVRAQQVYEKLGMNCDHYTTYEWMKNS